MDTIDARWDGMGGIRNTHRYNAHRDGMGGHTQYTCQYNSEK